ncbi:MAG TPA: hypothetical protein VK641_00485 [Terriglobales bacterium]|nr:hypothetical protein [Terriglobales bacterium]
MVVLLCIVFELWWWKLPFLHGWFVKTAGDRGGTGNPNFARAKLARIDCLILLIQGDLTPTNKFNTEVLIPELRVLNKMAFFPLSLGRLVAIYNSHRYLTPYARRW